MSVRRLAEKQPESFAFTAENQAWAEWRISLYPEGRQASAVISLLWRAQEQEGWVTEKAIEHIADVLGMAKIRVLEVATFYTMFHLEPVGRVAHLQVCGTTPCWLRGAEGLKEVCRKRISHEQFHLSDDGNFSWEEVECIGACVNAPLVQIGADTYEDLTEESLNKLIDDLAAGRPIKPGTQIDRINAAPAGGPTTLTDIGDEPPSSGKGPPDPQTPIRAAKPEAAAQTPSDPAGAISQQVEKAEDGQTTKEKREEKREATAAKSEADAEKRD